MWRTVAARMRCGLSRRAFRGAPGAFGRWPRICGGPAPHWRGNTCRTPTTRSAATGFTWCSCRTAAWTRPGGGSIAAPAAPGGRRWSAAGCGCWRRAVDERSAEREAWFAEIERVAGNVAAVWKLKEMARALRKLESRAELEAGWERWL